MELRFKDRIKLNKDRLLNYDDTYKDIYKKDAEMSWPGDFVGRYSLALSSLYQGLDCPNDKKEVLEALNRVVKENNKINVNKHFFFGKEFNDELINEQQMSGNSWYIRSLCNYYRITSDKKVLSEIEDIIENFLLKLAPHYSHYPMKEERIKGEVSGHTEDTPIDGFLLSSDIGCAFILLDGYVDAYSVTQDERLKDAIEKIINIFKTIDYIKLSCQTHATLTCSRAILRFYKLTYNNEYLEFVKKVFDDYVGFGMTLDYQNINWFNRVDSWTEPCCVIDSFILCHDLYLITKENKYLKLFGRISTTAPRIFQRNNGGAGCTTLLLNKDSVLKCFMYEAWFCCSMRLGEGMRYLSESRFIGLDDDSYFMMYPEEYKNEFIHIDADYYFKKTITVEAKEDTKLLIYVPDGLKIKYSSVEYDVKDNLLCFTAKKGEEVYFEVELGINENKGVYFLGDMLLTRKDKHMSDTIKIDSKEYSYCLSSADYSKEELEQIEQYL